METSIQQAEDHARGAAAGPPYAAENATVSDQCALDLQAMDELPSAVTRACGLAAGGAASVMGSDLPHALSAYEITPEAADAAGEAYVLAGSIAAGVGGDEFLVAATRAADRDQQTLHRFGLGLGRPGAHGRAIDASEGGPLGALWA
jgi:hypothetical protein